jgi:glutamyl-tRNA reductase
MAGDGLVLLGVSHRGTPVAVRERLSLDEAGVRAELEALRSGGLVREAMVIATCNRVELYAVTAPENVTRLRQHLAARAGDAVDPYLFVRHEVDAVRHLLRVASSLDSLVVGEPQILGQVKDAVRVAAEADALGPVLHRLSQRALHVAKHVRTHTDIGKSHVGVGNAGVWLAQQIFSSLKGRRAMLVGTGEMGRQVATAMVAAGIEELIVANRTFATAVEVAQEHRGTPIAFERIGEYLQRVDVVIAATGARVPILRAEDVRAAMKARRWRPLFLVDLSVPRNIDPAVDEIDQAYLFNVDDLTQVVERGKQSREVAAQAAEQHCEEEAGRFASQLAVLEVNDAIGRVVRHGEALRQAEIARSRRALDGMTEDQREAVDALTRALVKKLLHGPIGELRRAATEGDTEAVERMASTWGGDG